MMKTTTKKLGALMLALALILSLGALFVFAQPDATGRDPTLPVTLTINHYLFADGVISPGSVTGTPPPKPIGEPLEGDEWQIWLVDVPAGMTWDGEIDTIDPTWLAEYPGGPVATDADGIAVFTPDRQGTYLVREVTPGTTVIYPEFLVSLPYRYETTDEWVYNVHVFPKQQSDLIFEKDLTKYELGEETLTLSWAFKVEIRPGLGYIEAIQGSVPDTFIRITDVLDSRLTLVPDSVQVSFDDASGIGVTSLTDGWTSNGATVPLPGNTLAVNILEAGRDTIVADGLLRGFIYLTFDTAVSLDEMSISDLGLLLNDGTLHYGLEGEYEIGDPPGITLYGIDLRKVDTGDHLLPGATFHLYAEDDIDGTPIMVRTSGDASGDFGLAFFYGLPAGTYYLSETIAPAGYRLLTEPIQVVLGPDLVSPFTVQVSVTNTPNFRLPLTGGEGTLAFTVIGLALIGGSLALFIIVGHKKRKSLTGR